MGLTRFSRLIKTSPTCSKTIKINEIKIKRIGFEMSGYAYKFCAGNSKSKTEYLRRFFYLFIDFMKNGIIPVGIFDGKPPSIKDAVIERRRNIRKFNEDKIITLETKRDATVEVNEKYKIQEEIDKQKKKVVRLNEEIINNIKLLCEYMGVPYYHANGEADALFSYLHKMGKIDGVLSEDYDMFPFGISYIYRQYNQTQGTVVEHSLEQLLTDLGINQQQMIDLCIISGCDYANINTMDIVKAYELIKKYKTIENVDVHHFGIVDNSDKYQHLYAKCEFSEGPKREQTVMKSINDKNIELGTFNEIKLFEYLSKMCGFRKQTIEKWGNVLHTTSKSHTPTISPPQQHDYLLNVINFIAVQSKYINDKQTIINHQNYNLTLELNETKFHTYDELYVFYVIMNDKVLGYICANAHDVYNILWRNLLQISQNTQIDIDGTQEEMRIDMQYISFIDFPNKLIGVDLVCKNFQVYAKKIKNNDGNFNVTDFNVIPFSYFEQYRIFKLS